MSNIDTPKTTRILEEFGFRSICDDCSIETVARRQGLRTSDVVNALNRSIADNGDDE